jgi:peptide/nickel transport system ATP-binding protein
VSAPVLHAEGLRLELVSGEPVVEDVTFAIEPGEVLGLVGESGSGKTTTALALLGYHRAGIRRAAGRISVDGEVLSELPEHRLRRVRGRLVSYVPQEPATALNPSIRIGEQIAGMLRTHTGAAAPGAVEQALAEVALPQDAAFLRRFPHQLSGGQQQRIAIAVALVCRPRVVVLDEPTTGLDVVVQRGLLSQIGRIAAETGLGIVYVSHDLAVVGSIADRIAVMYAGRIVEEGTAADVMQAPRHPYTHGLVSAIPDPLTPRRLRGIPGVAAGVGERGAGCAFAPRCRLRVDRCEVTMPELERLADGHRVRCFEWERTPATAREPALTLDLEAVEPAPLLDVSALVATHRSRAGTHVAAEDVSFSISAGECVALVGESGSGKTTIARCIVGLHEPDGGTIALDGSALAWRAARRSLEARRRVQIVFQNPYDSLNPRHSVAEIVGRPARQLRRAGRREAEEETRSLLERVRLPVSVGGRYPGELSGGERQRVAIARALAARPDVLVCDEVTSALDVSVQGAVLELLADLRRELSLAMMFISHDLGVVASISDRVVVIRDGRVCEQGPVRTLLEHPGTEYTQRLIASAPRLVAT